MTASRPHQERSDNDPDDRAANELCRQLGFEPRTCVPKNERRCLGYEGDYYLNWARDKIEEAFIIAAIINSEGQVK